MLQFIDSMSFYDVNVNVPVPRQLDMKCLEALLDSACDLDISEGFRVRSLFLRCWCFFLDVCYEQMLIKMVEKTAAAVAAAAFALSAQQCMESEALG
jgi:hypothetical protein